MSNYGEQIRRDLEKCIEILRRDIGWLFRGEKKNE